MKEFRQAMRKINEAARKINEAADSLNKAMGILRIMQLDKTAAKLEEEVSGKTGQREAKEPLSRS